MFTSLHYANRELDGNGNPNSALVALEIAEMREGIQIDGIDKRWWDCMCPTLAW